MTTATAAFTVGGTNIHVTGVGSGDNSWEIPEKSSSEINPKLYFTYVKNRLKENTVKALEPKVKRLKALAEEAMECEQTAVKEELLKFMVISIREMECIEAGYGKYVTRDDIEKFIKNVKGKTISFDELSKFPRVLPKDVRDILKEVQFTKIFDEFHILHNNPTNSTVKTNKEKIIEKDPILFGRFSYDPERFFYITDWEDEYCDLTLEKFTEVLKGKVKKGWEPQQLEAVTKREMEFFKKDVMGRHERLKKTNPRNYIDLARQEDKKPWWKRMFGGK